MTVLQIYIAVDQIKRKVPKVQKDVTAYFCYLLPWHHVTLFIKLLPINKTVVDMDSIMHYKR